MQVLKNDTPLLWKNTNFSKKITNMKEIIKKYDNYIFDMDGIIWKGDQFFTNTINFIKELKSIESKKIFFLTNSTFSTREDLLIKLKKGNLELENSNSIYTSSFLLASFIN
jgi:4-nitrophenyl phosphatase